MSRRRIDALGYLAPAGFEAELLEELRRAGAELLEQHGRLVLARGARREPAWSEDVWLEPEEIRVESIGDAAKQLRAIQRNWVRLDAAHHRRAELITAKLPVVRPKPLPYLGELPTAPLGSWLLAAPDRVIASARCASPFSLGAVRFEEDPRPPSRAYLKLWELFTRTRRHPEPGQLCLELGSAPGGWTHVLASHGARVISIDRAPLDAAVAAMPGVEHRRESAFAAQPDSIGAVDWLFSDLICYPERLLTFVRRWLDSGLCRRFVCTLKFQGRTDHDTAEAFAAIEGSQLVHLCHNKHELTWFLWPDE